MPIAPPPSAPANAHAAFRRVTLHLARCAAFPQGSDRHGYEMLVPLRPDGHPDPAGFHAYPDRCRVRRFWSGENDRIGRLQHRAGGTGGAHWVIDYDETRADDDEAGYRFDAHAFTPGEYVTIRDGHGPHTFRVAAVEEPRAVA